MTAREVATYLDVALSTVHYWVKTGRLVPVEAVKGARRRVLRYAFLKSDVDALKQQA